MQHELQLLKETSQMAYSWIQFNLGFYKVCLMPEISTNGTIARNVNLVRVKLRKHWKTNSSWSQHTTSKIV